MTAPRAIHCRRCGGRVFVEPVLAGQGGGYAGSCLNCGHELAPDGWQPIADPRADLRTQAYVLRVVGPVTERGGERTGTCRDCQAAISSRATRCADCRERVENARALARYHARRQAVR